MRSMVEGAFKVSTSKGASPKPKAGTIDRARSLRRRMTLPEVILWQELRKRPDGLKFRRQHPSGPYILDFFCADALLAIEVDGEAHNLETRIQHDADRDEWFDQAGILTLRFPARDVLNDPEPIISFIVREARVRFPLHRPSGGPPPLDKLGEE